MRRGWLAFGIVGVAAAAVLLPAGMAWAPGTAPHGDASAAAPAAKPFPPDLQLAERTLQDPAVAELSGLAASRLHPGVLFGLNDSGNAPAVYALDSAGRTVATLVVRGAENTDWEALAPGVDEAGDPVLWIGDIGDNGAERPLVQLIRIAEPAVLSDQEVAGRSFRLAYPDGPHNAEALVVHPLTGAMWIITKRMDGLGGVYLVPEQLRADGINVMQRLMDAPTSITDGAWELSPEGDPRLVLTDYWQLHRLTGQTWRSTLGPLQLQREALAWPYLPDNPGNDEVLLGSEGTGSRIVTGRVP